jgi:hypothetical protein
MLTRFQKILKYLIAITVVIVSFGFLAFSQDFIMGILVFLFPVFLLLAMSVVFGLVLTFQVKTTAGLLISAGSWLLYGSLLAIVRYILAEALLEMSFLPIISIIIGVVFLAIGITKHFTSRVY